MKIYRVGGSVRDHLLGLERKDNDWVVVGATPEQMIEQGYKPVGKDFPVFLHPDTKDEYALARTERKTAPGYTGFQFHTSPDVAIEEDLRRRDLTINAIAETENGEIIDPYGGAEDLKQRRLRHVSEAFAEDPVRILRIARFAARFAPLGFHVAKETNELMKQMVQSGEVDTLVPERVWAEMARALTESEPQIFFETLKNCTALAVIFPEIDRLFGVPQRAEYHPEVDTGIHTMMVLKRASELSNDPIIRFAALVHDLGKGETPEDEWPRHHEHEKRSVKLVKKLCSRIRTPKAYQELALDVAEFHGKCHRADELKPKTVLKMLKSLGAFRKPDKFTNFLISCQADAQGRLGKENTPYPQRQLLQSYFDAANQITASKLMEQGLSGAALGEAIDRERTKAIAKIKSQIEQ